MIDQVSQPYANNNPQFLTYVHVIMCPNFGTDLSSLRYSSCTLKVFHVICEAKILSNIEKLNFYLTKNALIFYYNGESIGAF